MNEFGQQASKNSIKDSADSILRRSFIFSLRRDSIILAIPLLLPLFAVLTNGATHVSIFNMDVSIVAAFVILYLLSSIAFVVIRFLSAVVTQFALQGFGGRGSFVATYSELLKHRISLGALLPLSRVHEIPTWKVILGHYLASFILIASILYIVYLLLPEPIWATFTKYSTLF